MPHARFALCLALVLIHPPAAIGADAPPLSAAVLDFGEDDPALNGMGASAAALLQAKLSANSSVVLVERAELDKVLAEHELSLSGAVSSSQAARVGLLTGAEVIISGRVFLVGDRTHLVAKVISAANSRVFGATADYGKGARLDAALDDLAAKVASLLKERAGDLRGGKTLEETQLAAVKAKLAGRAAPKIYVAIKETVSAAPAPHSAAQTELRRILELAGCTIMEQAENADLTITGEAFAETGVRRGNLWFTRARLEITMKDRGGKTLGTERVVAGNVDLAQQISHKGALQKAGLLASTVAVDAWLRHGLESSGKAPK